MGTGKKVLIVLLVGVIAWAVYFFAYFQPKQEEIEELGRRLEDVTRQMEKKKRIANDLPKFNRELENLRKQLSASIEQLPNTKNIPELLEDFSNKADNSGVIIQKFTISPEAVKGFYAELPVSLELTGGYHNIAVFFDMIGKLDRIINIRNVSVRNPKDSGNDTIVTVTCLATTFRFLESEALR